MNFVDTIKMRKAAGFGALQVITRDEISCRKQLERCGAVIVLDPGAIGGNAYDIAICIGWEDKLDASAKLRRGLIERADLARKDGKLIVLLSPDDELHPDLESTFSVVKHALPEPDEHRKHFEALMKEHGLTVDMHGALRAVRGLTSTRQEDAFSLGIVDAKKRGIDSVDVTVLRRYKEQEVGDLGYLKMREPKVRFDDLIGHDYLKNWLDQRALGFTTKAREAGLPYPRGLLAVGPPGTGKSRFAEATAHRWSCPFLTLDVGAAMGKYLGESEGNINHALDVAERVSPCVMLIDEVDYALGGDKGDDGTTGRVVGKLLTWLATKEAPVFVFFTSNRPWLLPSAMVRKGRLDEIFCVDFPTRQERAGILLHYLGESDVAWSQPTGKMDDWSGAEIEAAVNGAKFKAFAEDREVKVDDLLEEIELTTPTAETHVEDVKQMREWAKKFARNSQKKGNEND